MTYSLENILQLENTPEFNKLDQQFNAFNPFKVLRVANYEIRHSNVLAWLFDPNENHRLNSVFLRKVLMHLIMKADNENKIDAFDYLAFAHTPLSDVVVHREWSKRGVGAIDLLIEIPTLNVIVFIENKVHAIESSGQLDRYVTSVTEHYPHRDILPVFLTLSGDAPSHDAYWMLTYDEILRIIKHELELNHTTMADTIHDFLSYYVALLEERLVDDEATTETALQLYQDYTLAIHLLYANANPAKQKQVELRQAVKLLATFDETTKQHLRLIYHRKRQTIDYLFKIGCNILRQAFREFVSEQNITTYSAHTRVPHFVMDDWLPSLQKMHRLKRYWLNYGLIVWFERKGSKRLKLYVEVGPINYKERLELLEALEVKGISFLKSGKQEEKKFTRIYTETIDVSDWTNATVVKDAMMTLIEDPTFRSFSATVTDMLDELYAINA
ncbi:PDDEXK-like family protein [Exiguobacterium alkaliphilum]|uniref:PD-(D/E)XK nuclease family protein n=1 Tax=Exiguobacterium alkaliphilum TaxID=1428684 RepID=A0ABT2KZJ8_9BACL|nr:PD-(D/E)XK nuclease family protein [Exiguobacterium alkaliphilum]MCT4796353.1 PD-(D/E)XK nuclease family protein [Exiguobacterium alkaliphilum]